MTIYPEKEMSKFLNNFIEKEYLPLVRFRDTAKMILFPNSADTIKTDGQLLAEIEKFKKDDHLEFDKLILLKNDLKDVAESIEKRISKSRDEFDSEEGDWTRWALDNIS